MNRHIFTYGSLMFAQVWTRVVRGRYRSAPARIDGYARFGIEAEPYPAMVVQPEGRVDGIVYFDVAPQDVAALDAFEGAEYRRDTVRVHLDSGVELQADTYIYLAAQRLLPSSWQPAAFSIQHFLERHCPDKSAE